MNLFKYYRLVRKWACKTYDIKDADLELLIYLDCKTRFTRNDFIEGVYTTHGIKTMGDGLRKKVGSMYGDNETELQLNTVFKDII